MDAGRRLMVAASVLLIGLVLAVGIGAGGAAASAPCNHPCSSNAPTVVRGPSSSVPCIRDAACSGGIALGGASGFAVALAVPTAIAALLLAAARIRRRPALGLVVGRFVAGGLFRPPRVLLGS